LLSGLQGGKTGGEACPDSLSEVKAYREAQVGQQRRQKGEEEISIF